MNKKKGIITKSDWRDNKYIICPCCKSRLEMKCIIMPRRGDSFEMMEVLT
jgi:hypothetical protein